MLRPVRNTLGASIRINSNYVAMFMDCICATFVYFFPMVFLECIKIARCFERSTGIFVVLHRNTRLKLHPWVNSQFEIMIDIQIDIMLSFRAAIPTQHVAHTPCEPQLKHIFTVYPIIYLCGSVRVFACIRKLAHFKT